MKNTICISLFIFSFACKPSTEKTTSDAPSITKEVPAASSANAQAPADSTKFPYAVPLMDLANKKTTSYEVLPKEGKPTVVLFWLTTCQPCARELIALQQNFESWQKIVPFHLVALSEDHMENYQSFVDRVNQSQWPFASYIDFERRFKELMPGNLNGLPQTFIFNQEGNMTWKKRGFLPGDESQYLEKIKEAAGI